MMKSSDKIGETFYVLYPLSYGFAAGRIRTCNPEINSL